MPWMDIYYICVVKGYEIVFDRDSKQTKNVNQMVNEMRKSLEKKRKLDAIAAIKQHPLCRKRHHSIQLEV